MRSMEDHACPINRDVLWLEAVMDCLLCFAHALQVPHAGLTRIVGLTYRQLLGKHCTTASAQNKGNELSHNSSSVVNCVGSTEKMDLSFPTDIQEFDADDRISFSRLDNKFIAVHDDGTEFEFDADLKKWVPADEEPLHDEEHDYGQDLSAQALHGGPKKKRQLDAENGSEVRSSRCHPTVASAA